jgi:hypothetical protein
MLQQVSGYAKCPLQMNWSKWMKGLISFAADRTSSFALSSYAILKMPLLVLLTNKRSAAQM